MIDIAKVREEMKALHAEATQLQEKYDAAEAVVTPEEQAAQDARLARLDKMGASLKNAEKLAKYSFSAEEPADEEIRTEVRKVRAELPRKSADQIAVERFTAKANEPMTREAYSAQLSAFVRGEEAESYAAITTASGGGLMLPSVVTQAINLVAVNPYIAALALLGRSPVTYGNTAKVSTPAVSPFAGSALPEDGSSETDANANGKLGMITTTPSGFQSGNFWYSGLEIGAVDYDVTQSHLPALAGASSRASALATKTAIKADGNVTQSVTTATTSIRIDARDADYVAQLQRSAVAYAERYLDQSLMVRTIEATFDRGDVHHDNDGFDCRAVELALPRGPVIQITSVTDIQGDAVAYTQTRVGNSDRIRIARQQPHQYSVTVTYRAGYETADLIPADILNAIRVHTATLYSWREDISAAAANPVYNLDRFYQYVGANTGVG